VKVALRAQAAEATAATPAKVVTQAKAAKAA
jgi:hypothetical protein